MAGKVGVILDVRETPDGYEYLVDYGTEAKWVQEEDLTLAFSSN